MTPSTDVAFGIVAVLAVTVATLAIGTWGLRFSRTTSDFFVASRSVRPGLNASAISGEYLSAASFLGIAGLVLSFGAEMLWYPIGWTAGYLVLLVLVAAPAAPVGRLHAARLRRGPARLAGRAHARLGDGRGHRLALRDAAARGRRGGAAHRDRSARVGRWSRGRCRRAAQRAVRRDALDHLRAGLPVLAQAHRAARPARVPGHRVARRRRPVAGRPVARGRRRSPVRRGPTRSPSPAATRSTPPTRSWSRPSSAPWACPTWWCASTPTPTAGPHGRRRSRCSRCSASSTCCRRCTPPSAGSTHPTSSAVVAPTAWCSSCRRG